MNQEDSTLVLIVDDTPKNIQLLGSVLKRHAFQVAVATSGKQALAFLDERIPDVILLDIMMPEMDGFDTCRIIKSRPQLRHVPVIFLTAKTEVEDKIKGFECGGADYIVKPFQAIEVIARVRTHAELKRANDNLSTINQHLQEEVEKRTKELVTAERQAAFALVTQGIVHNLRNPLAALKGSADLLTLSLDRFEQPRSFVSRKHQSREEILEGMHKRVNMLHAATTQMTAMIDSLMTKSRQDSADKEQVVSLRSLLENELSFLQNDSSFRYCRNRQTDLCQKTLLLRVVPGEIAQVFENLVRNALEAMYKQADQSLEIKSGASGDGFAWFSVADNGPGIGEENLNKIFDPFFTTKNTDAGDDSDQPRGTGLGLYSCQQIVESHGGRLEVDTQRARGVKFTVYLPLAAEARFEAPQAP